MIATQATYGIDVKSIDGGFFHPSVLAFTSRMLSAECKSKFSKSLENICAIKAGIVKSTEDTDVHAIDGSFAMKKPSTGSQQVSLTRGGNIGMSIQKPPEQCRSRTRASKNNNSLVFRVC
jgi:hypothetical protein